MIRNAGSAEVREVQLAVLRPDGPLPGDVDYGDEWLHVAAESAGRIVGACSVGPSAWPQPDLLPLPQPQWQLRSMAVLPEFRGGTGAALLSAAQDRARTEGAACLWANARIEALRLYLRAGWITVGPVWLKAGVGPHRWIVHRFTQTAESTFSTTTSRE